MEIKKVNINDIKNNEKELKQYLNEIINDDLFEDFHKKIDEVYDNMKKFVIDGSAVIIGAFEENTIIGFIWAYEIKPYIYHINYFSVSKNKRKQGIGQLLLNELYQNLKQKNAKKVELLVEYNNNVAINLYRKNDFKDKMIKMERDL